MRFVITQTAQKTLDKMHVKMRERILLKLHWYSLQEDPLAFATPLKDTEGLVRYRIGSYRVIVHPNGTILTVLKIGKRDSVYKR